VTGGNIFEGKDINNRSLSGVDQASSSMEGISLSSGIKGQKLHINQSSVEGEKLNQNHLEGLEKFEKPLQDYFKLADSASQTFAVLMGIKLNIFESFDELGDFVLPKDLLSKLNYSTSVERHLLDLLDELYVLGYLEREGVGVNARFRNSEYTKKYFLKKSVEHYRSLFLNLHKYMTKFNQIEKQFPTGKTQLFSEDVYSNEEDTKAYIEYFYKTNEFNFDHLINNINFSKYKKVMDIHGLTGCLTMKIKKNFPSCDLIMFENKKLRECAEIKIQGHDMQESIKMEFGDLLKDKIPDEVDCIVAPHILMHYNCENRKTILEKLFKSLTDCGDLIILENVMDEERDAKDHSLTMSFMLGVLGYEGHACTFEEYRSTLTEIGFKDVQRIHKKHGLSDILIASKRQTGL
jgi:phospholipid N-methyltransferase